MSIPSVNENSVAPAIALALEDLDEMYAEAGRKPSRMDRAFSFLSALTVNRHVVVPIGALAEREMIEVPVIHRRTAEGVARGLQTKVQTAALVGRAVGLLQDGNVNRSAVVAAIGFLNEAYDLLTRERKA